MFVCSFQFASSSGNISPALRGLLFSSIKSKSFDALGVIICDKSELIGVLSFNIFTFREY